MSLDTLVNQFGFVIGLALFSIPIGIQILKSRAATQDHRDRTEVDTRSRTEISQADAFISMVNALNKTVDNMGKVDERATQERQQTLMRIERMTGHIEGMTAAIFGNTKSSDTLKLTVDEFGNRLDEFGSRIRDIPQIKTDLDVLIASAKKLDAAIGVQAELLALMLKFGNDLETVSKNAITIVKYIREMATNKAEEGIDHEDTLVQTEAD